ncbi:MAG: hypothetical protein ACPG8V_01740 [Alphaproteobacteria bacterium]
MIKKFILKPVVMFIYNTWSKYFVICPYSLNEPKYMAKGVKPISRVGGMQEWIDEYEYPRFKELLKNKIVLEYKTSKKTINRFHKEVDLINLYFYYPNEEWRVHTLIRTWDNIDKYRKTISIRDGILLGYPKKYIRRYMLSDKILKWLINNNLYSFPKI